MTLEGKERDTTDCIPQAQRTKRKHALEALEKYEKYLEQEKAVKEKKEREEAIMEMVPVCDYMGSTSYARIKNPAKILPSAGEVEGKEKGEEEAEILKEKFNFEVGQDFQKLTKKIGMTVRKYGRDGDGMKE